MWLVAPYWTAQNTTITIEKSLRVRQESKRECYSLEEFLLKMAKMRWFGTWRCELNLYSHSVCLFILEDVRSTLCIHLFINLTNSYWKSTLYQGCVGQWRHNTQKANYLLLSHCSSLYFYLYLLPDRLVYGRSQDKILDRELCRKIFWKIFRKVFTVLKTGSK